MRARVCALGIAEGEADLYADESIPLRLRVAFTLGLASKRRAPVLSESELARQVGELVDLSVLVSEVEGDDDPGSSAPPAAPPPQGVGVEETARLHATRWIGDPLPPTVS